jgi:adenosylhomocysteine nucleosidase
MPKIAIVAALEREVTGIIERSRRVQREYDGRKFIFFEQPGAVLVCGGIGVGAARRAAEAVIALYGPAQLKSVGFAGALDRSLHVGDLFTPSAVIDARDGSRVFVEDGDSGNSLVTFMSVAGVQQKKNLARAFGAKAVDMEAAGVATAAAARGIGFSAIKVISDEFDFEMPAMERFIDAQGQFRTVAFAVFALLRPWFWLRVATLARNSRRASQALGLHLEGLGRQQHVPVEANTV